MSSEIGRKIKVNIFGESHGKAIGAVMDNIPAGEKIDFDALKGFMKRRQGGNNPYSTPRKESDLPEIISGVKNGVTTGAPLCLIIKNENIRSEDYKVDVPRPGHADFTAFKKYNGFCDLCGGGHFSGRLTAALCAAGGILLQILKRRGINITAHLSSVYGEADDGLNLIEYDASQAELIQKSDFPVLNKEKGEKMKKNIEKARSQGDSVGGTVECVIYGVPAGIGNPMFEGLENSISAAMFGIGGVKGIEFGSGFGAAELRGSQNNDEFYISGGEVKTKTNNHGGILGGISSGMPIVFNTAFKPTPSISKEQRSVSFSKNENVNLSVKGRHDPCIAVRAVPCVEAAAAIVIADFIL